MWNCLKPKLFLMASKGRLLRLRKDFWSSRYLQGNYPLAPLICDLSALLMSFLDSFSTFMAYTQHSLYSESRRIYAGNTLGWTNVVIDKSLLYDHAVPPGFTQNHYKTLKWPSLMDFTEQ